MNLLSNKPLLEEIKNEAIINSSEEICGLIIQLQDSYIPIKCINISKQKDKFFIINPLCYLKASRIGKIVACYHSQLINNELSNFDKINAKRYGLPNIMYCISTDSFDFFDPKIDNCKLKKYLGKPFVFGTNDCYNLVRQYYEQELNVILPEIKANYDWYEKDPNIFNRKFNEDFNKYFDKVTDLKTHDILIFKYKESLFPHHLGVYLGNNEFLHHPRYKYSLVEKYNNSFQEKTVIILRLKCKK